MMEALGSVGGRTCRQAMSDSAVLEQRGNGPEQRESTAGVTLDTRFTKGIMSSLPESRAFLNPVLTQLGLRGASLPVKVEKCAVIMGNHVPVGAAVVSIRLVHLG